MLLHRWHFRGPEMTALHLYYPDTAKYEFASIERYTIKANNSMTMPVV